MISPAAPPRWFELLLDEDDRAGASLPEPFQAVYGGNWRVPLEDPYVYVNFVVSRDGRVSFAEPGHNSGADVSDFDPRDQWLMGLLRARADAVMVGDGTLAIELDHLWTADFICPKDAEAFDQLRRTEALRPVPLTVFVSILGDLPWEATVFTEPSAEIVVATTPSGARAIETASPTVAGTLDVLAFGGEQVDLGALVGTLASRFGVERLLCEGGPRLYGSLLQARVAHDEFVTLSPLVLGDDRNGPVRPSLVEGVRFAPASAPRSRLVSVRRAGDHLYLRSRYAAG